MEMEIIAALWALVARDELYFFIQIQILLKTVARRLKINNTGSENNTTQQLEKKFNAMQCSVKQWM